MKNLRIRAGALRHHITFISITKSKNNLGETVENYTTVKTARAAIIQNKINEELVADGATNGLFKTFHLRFATWITADLLIDFDNNRYVIKSIDNPENLNQQLIITAEAI